MIVRKFVPNDLKRVYEIENMSFDQSYGIDMFQQLYEMGIGCRGRGICHRLCHVLDQI